MKNFFIKKISLVLLLLLVTNQLFSAGAHLSIPNNITSITRIIKVTLYNDSKWWANSNPVTIEKGATVDIDNGMRGFNRIIWTEQLASPDSQGNNFVDYELDISPEIGGLEGWRNWVFTGNGWLSIGAWALNKALNPLRGTESIRYH